MKRPNAIKHADLIGVLIVTLAAAAVRLTFTAIVPPFLAGDSNEYHRVGLALMTRGEFPLPLVRPPLYPAFIALVAMMLGDSLERLVAVQHALGIATAAATYLVGRLTFGRLVGLLSGLAVALSGGLVIYEHYVMTEALFTFLVTLSVCLLLAGLRFNSAAYFATSGLAVGLAALTRPHAQALLVLCPLTAAVWYRRPRPVLAATGLVVAFAALLLVPWMMRNAQVHGVFAVVGGTGQQLIFKTVRHSEFVFFDSAVAAFDHDPQRRRVRDELQNLSNDAAEKPWRSPSVASSQRELEQKLNLRENEIDQLMREAALDAIRQHPWSYARLVAEDAWKNFTGTPNQLSTDWRARDRNEGPPGERLRALISPSPPERNAGFPLADRLVSLYQSPRLGPLLMSLYLLGFVASLAVPAWRLALLPALFVAVYYLSSAVLVPPNPRYHYPPNPLLHVVALGGAVWLAQALSGVFLRLRRPRPAHAREWKPTA